MSTLEDAEKVLRRYEAWEARLILDDPAWRGSGLPTLTQAMVDELIEIQIDRNRVLSALTAERSELVRLREACQKSIGPLCMMVGELRDSNCPRGHDVLEEVLNQLRAALSGETLTKEK